jgi:hypothetical protein
LLDFRIPEISGLATARLLHQILTPTHCPRLIAVTAAADELEEIERHADKSSFDAIVSKQSGLQALIDAVEANAHRLSNFGVSDTGMSDLGGSPAPSMAPGMGLLRYDDVATDDASVPMQNMPGHAFPATHDRPAEIQTISLAAFRLTMGPAWARISYRAMQRAEQIIRRRLAPKDVVSRISDHGFAIWFHSASEAHIEAVLAAAVREIRMRFMMDYGEDVPPNPELLI